MPSSILPPATSFDDLVTGIDRAREDDLERLADAMLVAAHFSDLGDHLIGHYVDQARRAGRSWTEIGTSMGVSKQAARKRFNPKDPGTPEPDARDGFGNFTDAARNAVVEAQEQARTAGNREVGPHHLLLGVLIRTDPDGPVARVLVSQNVLTEAAIKAARAALPPAEDTDPPALIPYDEPARKCLELSFREALRLEHAFVGPEHMLLALLEQENGTGPLASLDLSKADVEADIVPLIEATLEDD